MLLFFFSISISKKLNRINRLVIKLVTLAELPQVTYRVSFLYFRSLKGLLMPQKGLLSKNPPVGQGTGRQPKAIKKPQLAAKANGTMLGLRVQQVI